MRQVDKLEKYIQLEKVQGILYRALYMIGFKYLQISGDQLGLSLIIIYTCLVFPQLRWQVLPDAIEDQ